MINKHGDSENLYRPPVSDSDISLDTYREPKIKHSRLGLLTFRLSILSIILTATGIFTIGILKFDGIFQIAKPIAAAIALVALILGIYTLYNEPEQPRIFPQLGIILSLLPLLLLVS